MKKYKRFIAPVLFCAVSLTAFLFFFALKSKSRVDTDHFIQEKAALLRLVRNSSEIRSLWQEGEDAREWSLMKGQCLKKFGITDKFDESLLRCHPLMLKCHALFSRNLNYKIISQSSEKPNAIYRYVTKANSSVVQLEDPGIILTIEDNQTKKRLDVYLEDQCHEVYLEERAYAYAEPVLSRDGVDYRFDNFDRHIYFDSHLVTNGEVNDWLTFGDPGTSTRSIEKNGNELFLPATDLTFLQMENFCSFKGKQIMMAHIFDATSFLPMDLKELIPKNHLRSPYYWTKKSSEFKADCSLFYHKECLGKKAYQVNSSGPSWAGLKDSLGGVFEVFRNPIDPQSNLKASSFYFEAKSIWHKLGFRAGWDGEGFNLRHFDFRGYDPSAAVEKFQVGFRCMREVRP